MAYTVYYPSGCNAAIPDHYCNPCDSLEHGRVRAVAYISSDWAFTDPTSPTEWQAGITAKKIIIIPQVNGTFDGGSEVLTAGYGDQIEKLVGYNFQVVYNDPNYKLNADFYNAIKLSRSYKFAYKTETQIHMVDVTVQAIPKNPVTEDPNSEVVWNVLVKWSDGDVPIPYLAPAGIFECFDYTGAIS